MVSAALNDHANLEMERIAHTKKCGCSRVCCDDAMYLYNQTERIIASFHVNDEIKEWEAATPRPGLPCRVLNTFQSFDSLL